MYVSYDKNNVITAVSETPFAVSGQNIRKVELPKGSDPNKLVGRELYMKAKKATKDLRVAVICNWGDACGIATYSQVPCRTRLRIRSPTFTSSPRSSRTTSRTRTM
jgi:hypothetical protein